MKLPALVYILLLGFNLMGCVSVDIAKPQITRSESISFSDPGPNFENRDDTQLDKLWINEKNGNSISFISDCNNRVDPSLKKIRDGVIKGLEEKTIISEKNKKYNSRKSLQTTVSGSVDGVATKLELVVFKKNSCIYIITYGAVAATYDQDKNQFINFLTRFKVK